MSILLDSLRKSEAQRKIKDAPSIHSAQDYGASTRRPRQGPAVAMIGVTAVAIAWFGWQQYADPGGLGGAPRAAAVGEQTADVAPERERSVPRAETGGDGRTPVEHLSPADAPGEADPAAAEGPSPAERIAGYVAEDDIEPYDDTEGEAFSASDGEGFSEVAEGTVSGADMPGEEALEELTDVRRAPPDRLPRTDPSEVEPRSYWHLPQSWRSDMPEFKITVLVYAEAPEDRFLLINGERLREGDELEAGVVLEEIRRDGAVFSYRQTRFMVKS